MTPTAQDYGRIGGIVTREQRKQKGSGYNRGRPWTEAEMLAAYERMTDPDFTTDHWANCSCPECGDDIAISIMLLCHAVEEAR